VDAETREMYRKVVEVSRFINATVRTISAMEKPVTSSLGNLPQVSAQLSDLTRLTEEGTHRVMGLTEQIQDGRAATTQLLDQLAALSPDPGVQERIASIRRLLAADDKRLLDIMTSLSFQDLVGQRVKKIVVILEDVQRRLLEMVVVFGRKPESKGSRNGTGKSSRKSSGNGSDKRRSKGGMDEGRAEQMLRELEASRTTALKQDLVDGILSECGVN